MSGFDHNGPNRSAMPAQRRELCDNALVQLAALQRVAEKSPGSFERLTRALEQAAGAAADFLSRLSRLAQAAEQTIEEMDFKFLFDPERKRA